MIDAALAQAVVQRLSALCGERLEDFTSEIQDDATFLFLTCRLPYGGPVDLPKEPRSQIVAKLNEMVPAHPEQKLGSWQLNVNRGAGIADALFPQEG
ncbi:hypothetical protein [Ramlibacter albus]|uniref:Uncharacterized protein n=1 Tax=Ramlibacter albus TaxID=2079448 RepID=A0A923S8R2_9BURK|nr:hypothetical protein [Ramlibacter albus]MBC5768337.1 hypothetical protein [Ramlibacter albus]